MHFAKSLIAASLLALSAAFPNASAQAQQVANPLITADENGNGTLLFPGGAPIAMPFSLTNNLGPGGLPNALTYNLLGPPGLVIGDVVLSENVGELLVPSDVVRFLFVGDVASFIFYSDNGDGADALADTGLPTALLANNVTIPEVGPEGDNGAFYTPTANQPGFVPGFNVTYHFISDSAVPEPATWAMMLVGFGAIGFALRRAKTGPALA